MDKALKQRLVGASVLVALAVIVLPMLLGGRPDGTAEVRKIELPPQPSELDFETRRYPIGAQPGSEPAGSLEETVETLPAPRPLPQVTPSEPQTAEPGAAGAPEALEEQESAPQQISPEVAAEAGTDVEPPPVRAPAGSAGRYVVQVASFGAIENATRLSAALGDYGYDVMTDTVTSDVGTLHRVRIGPYATEERAREAAARLQTQVGDVRPRIMDLRPEQGAQVTTPADPMVRWVVQVGSFSRAANAENLVARLRLESLSAFHEEVISSGSTIHRVRVGPFLEREEAIRVEQKLRDSMSLDGVVMSAD